MCLFVHACNGDNQSDASLHCYLYPAKDRSQILEECGAELFRACAVNHGKVLSALGGSLFDFLNNFNDFVERFSPQLPAHCADPPSFHCTALKGSCCRLEVRYETRSLGWEPIVTGIVKAAAAALFRTTLVVTLVSNQVNSDVYIRENGPAVFNIEEPESPSNVTSGRPDNQVVTERKLDLFNCLCCFTEGRKVGPEDLEEQSRHTPSLNGKPSTSVRKRTARWSVPDLRLDVSALCVAFPFHVLFNADLRIQQLGAALARLIGPLFKEHGRALGTYFELVRPSVKLSFKSILSRSNCSFHLQMNGTYTKQASVGTSGGQSIELKGQMLHLAESGCVLYLGSVLFTRLEQLRDRALFLSDIPVHDGARDLILVSEQALAQNALHKRMQQLKSELDRASVELSREKQHTEEVLEAIFPRDVARMLVHRQTVPARLVEDVTILFSDIVGFTTMAARARPMEVVEILNNLFSRFDKLCEELDLYKVKLVTPQTLPAKQYHQ